MTACYSMVRTGDVGPVGRSLTEVLARHLATVWGLMPERLASALRLA